MKKYFHSKNIIRLVILVLDVVLAFSILTMYRSNRRAEAARVSRLKKEVQEENELLADDTASAAELVEETPAIPLAISVRGDSFRTEEAVTGTDYPSLLDQLLIENGTGNTVSNYTIDVPGTLADLYYAGVSTETINGFIARNAAKDTEGTMAELEKSCGEVEELKLARNDRDAIPIIFIGYYGGFGEDPYELIEQQKEILATYSQQEYFLIVGTHPDKCSDTETFDSVMSGYWGNHYLNLSSKVPAYQLCTEEGHELIAEAIFARMKKLGLISVGQNMTVFID